MRAICESCAKPQPGDWRAGDFCIFCGLAVRHEVRCFWCTNWTPTGKYCRKCGADVLEDPALFAPARILKDAGTDRFTIPKLLREFDADRIETFRAIYQSQAAIVAAHVSDLAYIQTFLYQNVWADELEDQLTSELPWPEGRAPAHIYCADANRLEHIETHSPIAITKQLVSIAKLRRGHWQSHAAVARQIHDVDARIQDEAALTLSHWRVVTLTGMPREIALEVERILNKSRFEEQAQARLAFLFPDQYPLPSTLLASKDPDVRFTAALTASNFDMLRAVVTDSSAEELANYAAFLRLATAGTLDVALVPLLQRLEPRHLVSVIEAMARRKKPVQYLAAPLLALMQQTQDDRVRDRIATLLIPEITHETAIAISNLAPGDIDFAQILFRSSMPSETFEEVARRLLDAGTFRSTLYGLDNAAKPGHMPLSFVPTSYLNTTNAELRSELIRFAEKQLESQNDIPLLDFIIRCCFEEQAGPMETAWSATSRLCLREDHAAVSPFVFEAMAVERIYGSMDRFLGQLTLFLQRTDWHDNVLIFDPLSKFLRYADDNVFPAICESTRREQYVDAILNLIYCAELRGFLRTDCFYPLIGMAVACRKLREKIDAALQLLAAGPDLQSSAQYALDRIATLTGRPADTQ